MNTARLNVQLVPRRARPVTAAQVAQQLRPQLLSFPGLPRVRQPAAGDADRRPHGQQRLQPHGPERDTAELYDWAARLEAAIAPLPEVQDVSDDMQMKSPRVNLVIDRDKAAALGLNASDIESALYDGFGPQWSSTIYGPTAQYKVLLELDPQYQEQTDSLDEDRVQGAERRAGAARVGGDTSRRRSARRP